MGRVGVDLAAVPSQETRDTDGLGERALRIHEALDRRTGLSAEQIAIRSGIPVDRVRSVLPSLELTGHAERCDSGWRRRTPKPT